MSWRDPWQRWLKRLYQRYYRDEFALRLLRRNWQQPSSGAPFTEHVIAPRPDLQNVRNVLVFKPDEIGDVVYALPALAELRRALPHARIHVLCQKLTAPIFRSSQLCDEIATARIDRPDSFFARLHLPAALAQFSVSEFDLGIFLRSHPRHFRAFLQVPCRERVYPDDPRMQGNSIYRPQVELHGAIRAHSALQLLQIMAGVTGKRYTTQHIVFPEFAWTDADRAAVERLFPLGMPERFGVIHPFAKHVTRQYPADAWRELAEQLVKALPFPWVVIGGPDDPTLDWPQAMVQAQGKLNLAATGYLLSRANGFVGLLSGPAHWAAALGTPTAVLYSGVSPVSEWSPWGDALILRADVPCAPCESKSCPVYHVACMSELTPARILPALTTFLSRKLGHDAVATPRIATHEVFPSHSG